MQYIKFLEKIGKKVSYDKGAILFFEGESASKFFLLLQGSVRIYKSTPNEKQLTLHCFDAPNFIAEMPAFKRLKYPANAECIDECCVLEIMASDFEKLCVQNPEFSLLLIAQLFEKIKILEKQVAQNALPLRTKLLKFLSENEANLSKINQKTIATQLNIRAESLSRVLKELKSEKIIDTKSGKIVFLNKNEINKELW